MKKSLALLALSSVALFGSECYIYEGQQFGDCQKAVEAEVFIKNQTVVNNIVADTPKMDLVTKNKQAAASAQYVNAGDVSMVNIPLGMNIGSNFGVDVGIPVVSVKGYVNTGGQKEDNFGLGDISVGGNFHFGMLADSTGLNMTSLSYKTTTGDKNKGLGSGKAAYTLSQKFSKYVTDQITLNALLSYTLNDDSVSGNSYMAMIGGSMPCLLNKDVTTSAKVTYFHTDEVKKNNAITSNETKVADLWLNWDSDKYLNHLPIGFGVKIPLLNQVADADVDKTYLFYLSFSSFF